MIKYFLIGGLVGLFFQELLNTIKLYNESLEDFLKEIEEE